MKIVRLLALPALALSLAACAQTPEAPAHTRAAPLPGPAIAPAMVATTNDDTFLTALYGPGTDVEPARAQQLLEAGDRVCEGLTDGVPVAVMTAELMPELRISGDDARIFVGAASQILCAA
jgi:hypothetical protein